MADGGAVETRSRLSAIAQNAATWLQASNPSERWKWDVMYQDLPPVKGHNVQMEHAAKPSVIPLRLVTDANRQAALDLTVQEISAAARTLETVLRNLISDAELFARVIRGDL